MKPTTRKWTVIKPSRRNRPYRRNVPPPFLKLESTQGPTSSTVPDHRCKNRGMWTDSQELGHNRRGQVGGDTRRCCVCVPTHNPRRENALPPLCPGLPRIGKDRGFPDGRIPTAPGFANIP